MFDKNKKFLNEKKFKNSLKMNIDKNNEILVNYDLDIQIIENKFNSSTNDILVNEQKYLIVLQNFSNYFYNKIENKNYKVRINNLTITSNKINSDLNKEENLNHQFNTFYYKLKRKYFLQHFLNFSTFLMISIFLIFNKNILIIYKQIYVLGHHLIQINIINFLQICVLLIVKFEIIIDIFQAYDVNDKRFYLSIIIIIFTCIFFASFLWNLLGKYKISNIFFYKIILIFDDLLLDKDVGYFSQENQISLFLYLIFFLASKVSKNYEFQFKTKIINKKLKLNSLKHNLDYLNIPIIRINSEANFICNQAYIKKICSNFKFNEKFDIFEMLYEIDEQNKFENDIENLIKFIFTIQDLDLSNKNKNLKRNNESFNSYCNKYVNKNSTEKDVFLNEKLKYHHKNSSSFKLNVLNTKEDLNDIFISYKKIIDEHLLEFSNEIKFYHLISNNKYKVGDSQKEKIKLICKYLFNIIKSINADFVRVF